MYNYLSPRCPLRGDSRFEVWFWCGTRSDDGAANGYKYINVLQNVKGKMIFFTRESRLDDDRKGREGVWGFLRGKGC